MKEKYECPSCKRINKMNEEMDKAMKRFNMLIKKETFKARGK